MIKRLTLALYLSVLLLPIGEPTRASDTSIRSKPSAVAAPIVLRESVSVDGKTVRIGDLFLNVGEKAEIAIAYAPEPGSRAVFDARWLFKVARAYKLDWRPMGRHDKVVVQRNATLISREEIADQMSIALAEQGVDPDMTVEFSNRMLRLYVPRNKVPSIGIEDIEYEARTKRFSAVIHAPAGDLSAKRVRVSGRLYKTMEIPVPARRILGGEIITRQDIKWIRVRSARLHTDVIVDELDMIGKSPRRGLKAGYPVRTSAVRRPVLVPKGSLVTMILRAPKMLLTAQGKALQDGAEGDVIRITNSQSNKIVEAEVIAAGQVAVRQTTLIALNQQ